MRIPFTFPEIPLANSQGGETVPKVTVEYDDITVDQLVRAGITTQVVVDEDGVVEEQGPLHTDFYLFDLTALDITDAPYEGDWNRVYGDQFGPDQIGLVPMWRSWREPRGFSSDASDFFFRTPIPADGIDGNYWYGVNYERLVVPPIFFDTDEFAFTSVGVNFSTHSVAVHGIGVLDFRVLLGNRWYSFDEEAAYRFGFASVGNSEWFIAARGNITNNTVVHLYHRPYPNAAPFLLVSYGVFPSWRSLSGTAARLAGSVASLTDTHRFVPYGPAPGVIALGFDDPAFQVNGAAAFSTYSQLNWHIQPGG